MCLSLHHPLNCIANFTMHLKENNVKTNAITLLTFVAAAMISAAPQVYATQSFNGVISDSMCVKKHMTAGKTPAQCVAECIRNGSHYVLVTNDKAYTLTGKLQAVAPLAGKHVNVDGTVNGNAITVVSVHAMNSQMPAGMHM